MKQKGTSRRDFLRVTAAAGGALGLGLIPGADTFAQAKVSVAHAGPEKKLKILVLGGTGFIGPHTVRYAMDRGQRRISLRR